MARSRPAVPWQLLFLALGLIWGCSFLFIKLGLQSFTPVQVAFGRLTIGATTMLLISAATRTPLPRARSTWRHLCVTALLFCAIPWTLFAFGETHVPSILAGIINGATPLAALIVVMTAFPEERPSRERIAGLVVGFGGVLVVLGVWNGFEGGEIAGIVACVAAIACYGMAYPFSRRHLAGTGDGPIAIATGQMLLGTLVLLPVVVAEAALGLGSVRTPIATDTILGMLALGALGSGIAYVLNTTILFTAGGTIASAVTYVTPVVAVFVGVAFLGEALRWYEPVGTVVVLLGVAVTQGRIRLRVPRRVLGLLG